MLEKYGWIFTDIYKKWLKKVGGDGLKIAFFLSDGAPGGEI